MAHDNSPVGVRYTQPSSDPIIPCDLCNSRQGLRPAKTGTLLDDLKPRGLGHVQLMCRAFAVSGPSHLADPDVFDLAGIAAALADTDNSLQLSAER
jgi:tRNA 2-thiocytidine biosynthesis protein TtcA